MPFETRKKITRAMLRAEPQALFVFGDNMMRAGMGGQAAEMRGEPNAVGIPTKMLPSMAAGSFFSDADFDRVRNIISEDFMKLYRHIRRGGLVVWPEDDIGTGRAQLRVSAPRIARYIEACRRALEELKMEEKR